MKSSSVSLCQTQAEKILIDRQMEIHTHTCARIHVRISKKIPSDNHVFYLKKK